jgi:hypothetical protein
MHPFSAGAPVIILAVFTIGLSHDRPALASFLIAANQSYQKIEALLPGFNGSAEISH